MTGQWQDDWARQLTPGPPGGAPGQPGGAARPRRRGTGIIVAAVAGVLVLGLGVFGLTRSGGEEPAEPVAAGPETAGPGDAGRQAAGRETTGPGAPSRPGASGGAGVLPSGLTTSVPPAVRRAEAAPPVTQQQAFPDRRVTVAGVVLDRVDTYVTTRCGESMAPDMAAVVENGAGCTQVASALYSDPARRLQITIAVVTMNRAEDAATVFGMASLDPLTYQVAALNPPPAAGFRAPPAGAPGDFARLMSVRSVVFSMAQWSDGANRDSEEITSPARELLTRVHEAVSAYESSAAG